MINPIQFCPKCRKAIQLPKGIRNANIQGNLTIPCGATTFENRRRIDELKKYIQQMKVSKINSSENTDLKKLLEKELSDAEYELEMRERDVCKGKVKIRKQNYKLHKAVKTLEEVSAESMTAHIHENTPVVTMTKEEIKAQDKDEKTCSASMNAENYGEPISDKQREADEKEFQELKESVIVEAKQLKSYYEANKLIFEKTGERHFFQSQKDFEQKSKAV